MLNWHYNPANYNADSYQLIPPGKYRVRIENAEETTSKSSGKPMIKMTLKVSGYNSKIWKYIVLDDTNEEKIAQSNNWLGSVYDSFNIPQGSMNLQEWKGKVGAAEIINKLGDDKVMKAELKWFISRKRQDTLPVWQENPGTKVNDEMVNFDSDLPPF